MSFLNALHTAPTYWLESSSGNLHFSALDANLNTQVVVVGGGIAGVSIAYYLTRAGRSVILLESGEIGSGETGRTSAQLVTALDDKYFHLQEKWGMETTRLIAESHKQAIDAIEQIVRKHKIECLFERVSGYMFRHPTDDIDALAREYKAAINAGVEVRLLDEIPGVVNAPGGCLEFLQQAQFHPIRYLEGLCRAIIHQGGHIFTNTHVSGFAREGVTTSNGHQIRAEHIIVATNSPVNTSFLPHIKLVPTRTYLIQALIGRNSLPKAMWWDTGDHRIDPHYPPYHYVRIQPYDANSDLLLVGGEDHHTGDFGDHSPEERYKLLETWMRQHFEAGPVVYRWSGQVMQSLDSIAYIGNSPGSPKNTFIVTGDSGTGMTHATIAGMMITDMIMGKENPYAPVYKPSRLAFSDLKLIGKEMIQGLSKTLFKKPEKKNSVSSIDLSAGEGCVVNIDGQDVGIYLDGKGAKCAVDGRCPHMNALLQWNPVEKSWDCPWHGSRFTKEGKVIHGPANEDLKQIQIIK